MVEESSQFADFSNEEFELLFKSFDTNGDGVIERDEMKLFILEMCGFQSDHLAEMKEFGLSPKKNWLTTLGEEEGEPDINEIIKKSLIYEAFRKKSSLKTTYVCLK